MRKLIFTSAALMLGITSSVFAETYTITGGNWDSYAAWNNNATGDPSATVYDAGDPSPPVTLSGAPSAFDWTPPNPPTPTGTYSGTIETDASNNVIGGSLVVTGYIGQEILVSNNSWWYNQYEDLVINFDTNTVSVTSQSCFETIFAPASCAAGGSQAASGLFQPIAGNEAIAGAARPTATFDGTTLEVFHEGYSGASGTDYLHTFTLTSTTGGGGGPDVAFDDVTEAGDVGGVGSVAVLASGVAARVDVLNAATGASLSQNTFFDTAANPWTGIAIDTVSDGNSDGTADDPAVAMLAQNDVTGQIVVQTRLVSDNSKVGTHIPFFDNANWIPIDVAVVNDINGDGTTGDTGVAVLAESTIDGRFEVQMKLLSDESQAFKERFLNPSFGAGSVEAFVPAGGGDTTIAVMGLRSDGGTVIQSRQVSDGASLPNIFAFGSDITPADITILADGNGDGTANDPAVVILGDRVANGNMVTRIRDAATGAHISTNFAAAAYGAARITSITDANGNGRADVSATGRADSDDSLLLRTRDSSTNWIVNDISL